MNDAVDEVEDVDETESARERGGPIGFRTGADDDDGIRGRAPFGTAPSSPETGTETETGVTGDGDTTGMGVTREEEDGDESKLSSTPTEMTRVSGSSATTTVVDGATTTVGTDADTATAAIEEVDAAGETALATTVADEVEEAASASPTKEDDEDEAETSTVAGGEAASGCDGVDAGPSSFVMVISTMVIKRSLATG